MRCHSRLLDQCRVGALSETVMQRFPQILTNQRGAAFAEALISLPVFVAVLGGTVALNGMYAAKLEAKSRARRAAWLQADSGECPPSTCTSSECEVAAGKIRAGGLDRLPSIQRGRFALGSILTEVGSYLVGKATRGVGSAEASMPSTWKSRHTEQHGVTTLICNTTARHLQSGGSVLEHACATGLETTEYAREVCK